MTDGAWGLGDFKILGYEFGSNIGKAIEVGYKPFGAEAPWLVRQLKKIVIGVYAFFILCTLLVVWWHDFTYRAPKDPWLDAFAKFELFIVMGQWLAAVGLIVMAVHIDHMKSVSGVSEHTIKMISLSQAIRMATHITQEGFEPNDGTIDWHLYQLAEMTILLCGVYILLKQFNEYRVTQTEETFPVQIIYGVSFVAAIWFRESVGKGGATEDAEGGVWQAMWMFCLWIDSLALLPQILLSKQMGTMEWSVAHYTFMSAVGRVFHGLFWVNFMLYAGGSKHNIDVSCFGYPVILNFGVAAAFVISFVSHAQEYAKTGSCFNKGGADEGTTFEFQPCNDDSLDIEAAS